MNNFRPKLKGGDLRSLGSSHQVVKDVLEHPDLFADLFTNLFDADRLVRMRAADSIEKVTREHPELLQPWKRPLLETISNLKDKEVRWHVAQMLPRLRLTTTEQETAVQILISFLSDESSIVKTHSMQALADLAMRHGHLLSQIQPLIDRLTRTGTPAMRARGRKLIKQLERSQHPL